MTPALRIVKIMMVLAIIATCLSGMYALLAIASVLSGNISAQMVVGPSIIIFFNCLFAILSIVMLRCFVQCMDSIETTVRRIEDKMSKDDESME
jgi:hypothetical protein